MLELLKSRIEDALKEATQGVSAYTIFLILIYTLLINFNDTHLNQALHSLLNTKLSELIGEKSILLKIQLKDILYATIAVTTLNKAINSLRSEYFDLLYLTILKSHIVALKSQIASTKEKEESELISTYHRIANKQNFLAILGIAISITATHDERLALGVTLGILTLVHIIWAMHKSAKFLISKILPAIVQSTPDITPEQIDDIFSNL